MLVVACADCRRQYDATGRSAHSRFRCRCGAVVIVEIQEPREVAVTRCSSCGAPRADGAGACAHCGSDIAREERDRDANCPHCLARVSARARYCHGCGSPRLPEVVPGGDRTELSCPACTDARLHARTIGPELPVLECERCAGLWVSQDAFAHAISRAEIFSTGLNRRPEPADLGAVGRAAQAGPAYRPCILCGARMNRSNYGRRSNVVIDVCRQHGIWFDEGELTAILGWVRAGGLEQAREADREQLREERERLRRDDRRPSAGIDSAAADPLRALLSWLRSS